MANNNASSPQGISEQEIRQNSGVSATMALQAAQKAWQLRQAANAAGDPNAREEILAKAINKEIEAESFGKAAKYTRSGAFQGLAAGAGLGVQPGVTLGKLTGALVGGVVATVTGLLGGGIGSVYGAMHGPFWNLGEIASHGVRSIIGDFPNWKSTPAQKKALEKMVMQTKDTQAPTKEELEEMSRDAPDDAPETWSQTAKDMTSWKPSMPSMSKMPSMPTGAALGLGGLGASMPSWGGKSQKSQPAPVRPVESQTQSPSQAQNQRPQAISTESSKKSVQQSREAPKPKEIPQPKDATSVDDTPPKEKSASRRSQKHNASPATRKPTAEARDEPEPETKPKSKPALRKQAPKEQAPTKPMASIAPPKVARQNSTPKPAPKPATSAPAKRAAPVENKDNKSSAAATESERRKPRKLSTKSDEAKPSEASAPKKAPRKLESRKPAA